MKSITPLFKAKKVDGDDVLTGQYVTTQYTTTQLVDNTTGEEGIKHCITTGFIFIDDAVDFVVEEIDISTMMFSIDGKNWFSMEMLSHLLPTVSPHQRVIDRTIDKFKRK